MAGQAPEKQCVSLFTIGVIGRQPTWMVNGGMNHPELGAKIAGSLFGDAYYDLVLLHSRRLARELGATPSKLCWADKA